METIKSNRISKKNIELIASLVEKFSTKLKILFIIYYMDGIRFETVAEYFACTKEKLEGQFETARQYIIGNVLLFGDADSDRCCIDDDAIRAAVEQLEVNTLLPSEDEQRLYNMIRTAIGFMEANDG